jgi:hypothetical protein
LGNSNDEVVMVQFPDATQPFSESVPVRGQQLSAAQPVTEVTRNITNRMMWSALLKVTYSPDNNYWIG